MAKTYAVVIGVVLLLVGILGFVPPFKTDGLMGLQFTTLHNVIHLLTGVIGVGTGLSKSANAPRVFAQVFGVIYTLVAILGFANIDPLELGLTLEYNIIHLVIGLWGLAAGFAGSKTAS